MTRILSLMFDFFLFLGLNRVAFRILAIMVKRTFAYSPNSIKVLKGGVSYSDVLRVYENKAIDSYRLRNVLILVFKSEYKGTL